MLICALSYLILLMNYSEWVMQYNIPVKINEFFNDKKDKISWSCLSFNPNGIPLLEQNQDDIYWPLLSLNPNAIHLLEQNKVKIDWRNLSRNPNAIHILEQNQDKIV